MKTYEKILLHPFGKKGLCEWRRPGLAAPGVPNLHLEGHSDPGKKGPGHRIGQAPWLQASGGGFAGAQPAQPGLEYPRFLP